MMFSEKVAIVTGGSSGIGYSTVIEMSSRGAAVIIADVDEGPNIEWYKEFIK